MHAGDLWVVVLSIIFLFILSHISVDEEFPPNMKVGAHIVIWLIVAVYIIFGVIF